MVYLDTNASSVVDPRVLDSMIPAMLNPGNPHSPPHPFGKAASMAVEKARSQVAALINCSPRDVIFTSGATESNNLAIKGAMRYLKQAGKNHVITTAFEHKCVLESVRDLQSEGFEATIIEPSRDGFIDAKKVEKAVRPTTGVISIMLMNNEIGTIQPVASVASAARRVGAWLHSDAAQACGRIPVDVGKLGVQMLSVSAHKMHGPKGVGALFVSARPRVRLSPILSGGGQERGMRSGTLAAPTIVGFGRAAELASRELLWAREHVTKVGQHVLRRLKAEVEAVTINGSENPALRWLGCLNASFEGVEGEALMTKLARFALSSGSACTSASLEPSYVLRALGVPDEMAHTSLRIGISKFSTLKDVDDFVDALKAAVADLRKVSLLWDMRKRGIDPSKVHWIH